SGRVVHVSAGDQIMAGYRQPLLGLLEQLGIRLMAASMQLLGQAKRGPTGSIGRQCRAWVAVMIDQAHGAGGSYARNAGQPYPVNVAHDCAARTWSSGRTAWLDSSTIPRLARWLISNSMSTPMRCAGSATLSWLTGSVTV